MVQAKAVWTELGPPPLDLLCHRILLARGFGYFVYARDSGIQQTLHRAVSAHGGARPETGTVRVTADAGCPGRVG
jgi:hypothetical protein